MQRNRVLIIEQDRRTVDQLQEKLETVGMEAEIALSGDVGLTILREREMDAAVVDAKVGDFDGWDLLRAIKRSAPQLPVVFINGRARKGESRVARRAGAARFIRTPADPDRVINAVHQVLTR